MSFTLTYTNYTNLDARFGRPYEPGDRLVKGHSGPVPGWDRITEPTQALLLSMLDKDINCYAEDIFAKHNRDDRPDGQLCPSMSVGDVVVIGEVALSVASAGFVPVTIDQADVIADRTWSEVAW